MFAQHMTDARGYHFETENGVIVATDAPGFETKRPLNLEKFIPDHDPEDEEQERNDIAFDLAAVPLEPVLDMLGESWESIDTLEDSSNDYQNLAAFLLEYIGKAQANAKELEAFRKAIGNTPLDSWKRGEAQARGETAIVVEELKRVAIAAGAPLPEDFEPTRCPTTLSETVAKHIEERDDAKSRFVDCRFNHDERKAERDVARGLLFQIAAVSKQSLAFQGRAIKHKQPLLDQISLAYQERAKFENTLESLHAILDTSDDVELSEAILALVDREPSRTIDRLRAAQATRIEQDAAEVKTQVALAETKGFQRGLKFAQDKLVDWNMPNRHSSQCATYLAAWNGDGRLSEPESPRREVSEDLQSSNESGDAEAGIGLKRKSIDELRGETGESVPHTAIHGFASRRICEELFDNSQVIRYSFADLQQRFRPILEEIYGNPPNVGTVTVDVNVAELTSDDLAVRVGDLRVLIEAFKAVGAVDLEMVVANLESLIEAAEGRSLPDPDWSISKSLERRGMKVSSTGPIYHDPSLDPAGERELDASELEIDHVKPSRPDSSFLAWWNEIEGVWEDWERKTAARYAWAVATSLEKTRRVYYQNLVYAIATQLEGPGEKITVGTSLAPCDDLIEVVKTRLGRPLFPKSVKQTRGDSVAHAMKSGQDIQKWLDASAPIYGSLGTNSAINPDLTLADTICNVVTQRGITDRDEMFSNVLKAIRDTRLFFECRSATLYSQFPVVDPNPTRQERKDNDDSHNDSQS